MSISNNNEGTKDAKRSKILGIAGSVGAAVLIAIVLGSLTMGNNTNSVALPPAPYVAANHSSATINEQTYITPNICGELSQENGHLKTPGTYEDQVILNRGGSVAIVPICFRSTDPSEQSYALTLGSFPGNPAAGYKLEKPESYGLQANLDKAHILMPPQKPWVQGVIPPIGDRAMVRLSASTDAIQGPHVLGVQISYQDEIGQTVMVEYPVYLKIQ